MNEKSKSEVEVEQRNVPLAHFPSGADGTEPAKPVSEEGRAKVEQCVVRQRQKLTQIADLALAAEAKSNNANVKLGSKYLENSKALCAIRELVGPGLTFEDEIEWRDRPIDPTAPEMKRGEGRLFKYKHNSMCHGTYIYDRICINDAHIRAALHPDDGGLKQCATIWIDDSQRCFCYCTFNTTSPVKCDYVVRGILAGLAKRLVYHHKNLIKRKAKWAAAKQQAHDNKGAAV